MEKLIDLYKSHIENCEPEIFMIKGEGSNRKYYRLKGKNKTVIGVVGEDSKENSAFISLSNAFKEASLPVPQIFAVSDDKMRYIQEDLGDLSLFQAISRGINSGVFSENDYALIEKAIKALARIQFEGAGKIDFSQCFPVAEFDYKSVMWDLNYFKYCFLKLTKTNFSETELEKEFEVMAEKLISADKNLGIKETRTFMYRDFQSRNVMIKNGEPYMIDYQGGRKGPFLYDLVSFAWQAKANFPDNVKEKIIQWYVDAIYNYIDTKSKEFQQNFDDTLNLFVLFRSLQVLGAYGYRGIFEKKPHFIESIPFALKNAENVLKKTDSFPYLYSIIKNINDNNTFKEKEFADTSKLTVKVYSFSYKKGIPEDNSGNGGGYVFDCRAVHNPGRYEQYKALTGLDKPVIDFLEKDAEIIGFLESVYNLADAHVSRYIERGFTSLIFCFGCTGGQHRSVYSAQHTAEYISKKYGVRVELCHREQKISQVFECKINS